MNDQDNVEKVQALTFTIIDAIHEQTSPAIALATLVTLIVGIVLEQAEDEAVAWEGLSMIEQGIRMQFAEVLQRKFS